MKNLKQVKNSIVLLGFCLGLLISNPVCAQDGSLKEVAYKTIAEGTDSPMGELHIVCFNKYFNRENLPSDFRKKYDLDEKSLYKKKMLIEVFQSDRDKKGLDKIEFIGIEESEQELIMTYNLVNSNKENDDQELFPFLVVQVPKSKKQVTFVANGTELGKGTKLYMD